MPFAIHSIHGTLRRVLRRFALVLLGLTFGPGFIGLATLCFISVVHKYDAHDLGPVTAWISFFGAAEMYVIGAIVFTALLEPVYNHLRP